MFEEGLKNKKYTYPDGSIYEGNMKYINGKYIRDGRGNMHWKTKTVEGKFVYQPLDEYDGEWVNDKMHGFGTYIEANGTNYTVNYQ